MSRKEIDRICAQLDARIRYIEVFVMEFGLSKYNFGIFVNVTRCAMTSMLPISTLTSIFDYYIVQFLCLNSIHSNL